MIQTIKEVNNSTKLSELKAKERGIISQCLDFNIIICLGLMHPIFQLIVKVSKTLEDPKLNILMALEEVKSLRSAMEEMRSDSDFCEENIIKL